MARSSPTLLHRQFSTFVLCGATDDVRGLLSVVSQDTIDHGLGVAAYDGNEEIVRMLLPYSDPIHNGCRPLVLAAMNGKLPAVLLLLPYGVHQRAIVEAARMGHADIVEALCERASRTQVVHARGVARRGKWNGVGVERLMTWCEARKW